MTFAKPWMRVVLLLGAWCVSAPGSVGAQQSASGVAAIEARELTEAGVPLTRALAGRADAQREIGRQEQRGHPLADGPEDRGVGDRCLMGFNAGPPMLPGGYNQNVQIFQTADHLVVFNEMIHNARIIPLDGRPHGTARAGGGGFSWSVGRRHAGGRHDQLLRRNEPQWDRARRCIWSNASPA